jgi:uncharacterized membrane protein YczE
MLVFKLNFGNYSIKLLIYIILVYMIEKKWEINELCEITNNVVRALFIYLFLFIFLRIINSSKIITYYYKWVIFCK